MFKYGPEYVKCNFILVSLLIVSSLDGIFTWFGHQNDWWNPGKVFEWRKKVVEWSIKFEIARSTNSRTSLVVNSKIVFVETESWITPELSEVHVEGEVHVLLAEVADAENVEADADCDRDAAVVGPHPPVVADLERVQDVWDVDSWESSASGSGDDTLSLGEHWKRPEKGEEGQKNTLFWEKLCHGDKIVTSL